MTKIESTLKGLLTQRVSRFILNDISGFFAIVSIAVRESIPQKLLSYSLIAYKPELKKLIAGSLDVASVLSINNQYGIEGEQLLSKVEILHR